MADTLENDVHELTQLNNEVVLAWLHRHGGQATARDLARSSGRRFSTAKEAQAALAQLADAGLGRWEDVPSAETGRPPKQVFVLSDKTRPKCPTKVPIEPEK